MAMQYGALGAAFHLVRLFQFCSLIAIIGIEGKFIAVIVGQKDTPSDVHIGVISVVSFGNTIEVDDPSKGLVADKNPGLYCRHVLYC